MYINREGVTSDYGVRGNMKEMFFDIESMFLIIGKDAQQIAYDVYDEVYKISESVIDLRWNLFLYKMQSRGLVSPSNAMFSKKAALAYSLLGMIMLR